MITVKQQQNTLWVATTALEVRHIDQVKRYDRPIAKLYPPLLERLRVAHKTSYLKTT